jgi:type I restriction enzyme S subunit
MAEVRSKSGPGALSDDVTFLPMEAVGDRGDFDHDSVKPCSEIGTGYSYFEEGDVLRAKVTPCFENGKGAVLSGLVGGRGFGSTELLALRPLQGVDPRFLYYVLISQEFTSQGTGYLYGAHGVKRVPEKFFRDFEAWSPVESTQRAIGDFLDRETSQIDALIDRKLRLLTALSEAQPAAASMVLLGTIDGPGSLHANWPASWGRVPFRWLFKEVDERSADGSEELMSVSQTRGVIAQAELGERHQFAETLAGYKICRKGDLVINRMWVYYGALGVAPGLGLVSPDYSVFRRRGQLGADLASYILRTPPYVGEMTRLVRGVGSAFQGAVRKPRLHPRELGQIVMPVPPKEEQPGLIAQLVRHRNQIDERARLIERSVALLQERRQALITAAVSGELEIPGAA